MLRANLAPLGLGVVGLSLLLQGCASTGESTTLTTEATEPEGPRADVVTAALSQIGTRYRYGAQSPGKALDCSALMQHAYGAAGLSIPRVSTAQHKASTPVSLSKVKPGDLVFFRIRRGLYHVGMMVGKKHFVHASTSKKQVRLSRLDTPYWQRRVIGAGTYIN